MTGKVAKSVVVQRKGWGRGGHVEKGGFYKKRERGGDGKPSVIGAKCLILWVPCFVIDAKTFHRLRRFRRRYVSEFQLDRLYT